MKCVLSLAALSLFASVSFAQVPCGTTGVTVTVSPQNPSPGETIDVTIINGSAGNITLPNLCTFQAIYPDASCSGTPTFFPACPEVLVMLQPGGMHTWSWDQLDNTGVQVNGGTYYFSVSWLDFGPAGGGNCCVPVSITLGSSGCFGDGGDQMGCTDCPCGNNAALGTGGGCLHSQSDAMFGGSGAILSASGSASLTDQTLCFTLENAKPSSFGVLTSSTTVAPANPANPCMAQNPGSGIQSTQLDGLRCVVQGVLRHGARPILADGTAGIASNPWGYCSSNFANSSGFMAGEERHFQVAYREDAGVVCATEQNTSQRVSITLTP